MFYYSFHVGDYIHDTAHLTNEEDLAFRRLLDLYYTQEKPIPNKTQEVARRLRMGSCVTAVETVLQEFFYLDDEINCWRHKRCDETIAAYQAKSERNRIVGKLGGRPKTKPTENPNANPQETQMVSKPNPNHKPITNNQENTYICPPDGGLPLCEHEKVISLYHKHLPTLRRVEIWNETRKSYLRQRWREVAEDLSKTQKVNSENILNWFAEFFDHIGKSKFLTGKVNSKDGRAFVADLEWILKPSNFAKIIEGKYHGVN